VDTSNSPFIKTIVQVVDNSNNRLTGFKIGNFSILEDGKPGVPLEVGVETDPIISVAIVLDRSGTMQGAPTDSANAGATALVNALSGNDRAALIEFESSARVVTPFTSDKAVLLSEINQPAEGGATAYFDGIVFAANILAKEAGLKLMIFLSDGDADNASTNTAETMKAAISGLGMIIYGIVVGSNLGATQQYLDATSTTGGQLILAPSGTGLESTFLSILNADIFKDLVFIKFRRRSFGDITVYLNYGTFTAQQKIKTVG
jgi:hypothetical protein